jgi:Tol biopolymer transport system component
MPPSSPRSISAWLVLCSLLLATSASAQYFGRNKVVWRSLDFHVMETPRFDIYHYPEETPGAQDAARMAERWHQRLAPLFGHEERQRKPIVLYADHSDFRQTNIIGGFIGEGTGGFAEPFRDRLVMPLTGIYASTDHILGHELVHSFQFDLARAVTGQGRERVGLHRLPLWMVEGLAEYLSVGREDPVTAMWMRDAVLHDDLPSLRRMSRDFRYNPYRFGQAFWAFVGGEWGDPAAMRLFSTSLVTDAESAFPEILGVSVSELEERWHQALRDAYQPQIEARQRPEQAAEPLITRGRLNLAPTVSPDGRWVAFLSSRDLFSIDLYLADARTGEIERRLFSADRDAHFESLRFIDSSGSWSPDSRRLAFVGFRRGTNVVAVLDVETRRIEERIVIPEVRALANPAWSPDGRTLVVTGMRDGISDLYLVDVQTGSAEQLMDDRYADLQPTFSPDGRTIAFVSDRQMDLENLIHAPMEIYLMDMGTREVRRVPLFEGTDHTDPKFSADGQSLYFVAAPDGIPDVFRHHLATGATERLTRIATGVAGITALSPALSVSPAGDLVFSVFDRRQVQIYRVPAETVQATAAPVEPTPPQRLGAVLPPVERHPRSVVAEYLVDTPPPLPPQPQLEVEEYRPRLGLDMIGPVGVGVWGGESGLAVGGAVSAYFSDMLGDHQVALAVQGGGETQRLRSLLGAEAFYVNRTSRLAWGALGSHIPHFEDRIAVQRGVPLEIDGEVVAADVFSLLRREVVISSLSGLTQYPFSMTRRVEGTVGYTRIEDLQELEQVIVVGNTVVGRQRFDVDGLPTLDLAQGNVAFVGDNSSFGFISPVRGGRMRVELGATTGTLDFGTALADARRYFYRRPLTFAVRGVHFGRYGGDAESQRLRPLFVGRESWVRGYTGFSINECTVTDQPGACPEIDRLFGSRIGVVNAELRVPLFGTDQFGLIDFPALPTEISLFFDGGVAWTSEESPHLDFTSDSVERIPVFSAGVAARILLLGALPIELYYAFPFQRPERSGIFGLMLRPGW